MRGTWHKWVIGLLAAAIFSVAPLGALLSVTPGVEVVRADSGYPDTLKQLITANKGSISQNIADANETNNQIKEFLIVLGKDPSSYSNLKDGVTFILDKYISGITAADIHPTQAGKTVGTSDGDDTWNDSYDNVYNSVYHMVYWVDSYWETYLTELNTLADLKDNNFHAAEAGSSDPNLFRANEFKQKEIEVLKIAQEKIVPYAAMMMVGLDILKVMNTKAEVVAAISDTARFNEQAKDLDLSSKQVNHILAHYNYAASLASGSGSGTIGSTAVYPSSTAFYSDLKRMTLPLFDNPSSSINTPIDAVKLQLAIKKAAEEMDKANLGKPIAGEATVSNRCGVADKNSVTGIPDIGQSILVAICNIVLLVQEFSINVLRGSLDALGQVSCAISGGSGTTNASGSFLTSLIPAELTCTFLADSLSGDVSGPSKSFHDILIYAHGVILRALNILLILLFLAMALATMFQVQLGNYSVQKLLAPVVIGFVLAQASLFIIRVMVEAETAVQNEIVSLIPNNDTSGKAPASGTKDKDKNARDDFLAMTRQISSVNGSETQKLTDNADHPNSSLVFQQAILNIFVFAAAVIVFMLAFEFALRTLILSFLIPLSGAAFFAAGIPPMKSLWTKWWKNFSNWLFMPIAASFWIWLAFTWLVAVNNGHAGTVQSVIGYLFAMGCFVTAIKTSASMFGDAGDVMKRWQGAGKKAWGATGGAALKNSGKYVGDSAKILYGQTSLARMGRDYKAAKKRREERVKIAMEQGIDVNKAEKRGHQINHLNEELAEKEAELVGERDEEKRKKLQESIDHIKQEIKDIDEEKSNKRMLEELGRNVNRARKDALEHQILKEVQTTAELRMADFNHEYQEHDALIRESTDRTGIASERIGRVNKSNYEGMIKEQWERATKDEETGIVKDRHGNILEKDQYKINDNGEYELLDKDGNRIKLRDDRTGLVVGGSAQQVALARMRTALREDAGGEKYAADKMESDRVKQEAREYLATHKQPNKEVDYLSYQKYERALDNVRDEVEKKATVALDEVHQKPFVTARMLREEPEKYKKPSAHYRLLNGPLELSEEEIKNEAVMKGLSEAAGHLRGLTGALNSNNAAGVRQAANRIMDFVDPEHVDEHLLNLTMYGNDEAIKNHIGTGPDSAAKLQAAIDAGLISDKVTDVSQINATTVRVDDPAHRALASAFSEKSKVSGRIYKISGEKAEVFKSENYTKDPVTGKLIEDKFLKSDQKGHPTNLGPPAPVTGEQETTPPNNTTEDAA